MTAKTILLVEPEVSFGRVLTSELHSSGLQVWWVADLDTAQSVAMTQSIDLAIVDTAMAEIETIALLRALQRPHPARAIPVIVLTSASDSDSDMALRTAGATEYLVKSDWQLTDIVAKIHRHLTTAIPAV